MYFQCIFSEICLQRKRGRTPCTISFAVNRIAELNWNAILMTRIKGKNTFQRQRWRSETKNYNKMPSRSLWIVITIRHDRSRTCIVLLEFVVITSIACVAREEDEQDNGNNRLLHHFIVAVSVSLNSKSWFVMLLLHQSSSSVPSIFVETSSSPLGFKHPTTEVCSLGGSFCTDETSQIHFFFKG